MMSTVKERLLAKVEYADSGCWEFQGSLLPNGYGYLYGENAPTYAHRLSYIVFRGPIPDDLELDHLCRNRRCVNPDHLEAVTHLENVRRSEKATRSTCPNGHAYGDHRRPNGRRRCRECARIRAAEWYRRKRHSAMSDSDLDVIAEAVAE